MTNGITTTPTPKLGGFYPVLATQDVAASRDSTPVTSGSR